MNHGIYTVIGTLSLAGYYWFLEEAKEQ